MKCERRPDDHDDRDRYDAGNRRHGFLYARFPREDEQAFPVPVTLFTSGWIHILEDTGLLMVLMLAALHHQNGGQSVQVDGETRLLRYGIGRNAYAAHVMLSALGLATVTPTPAATSTARLRATTRARRHCCTPSLPPRPDRPRRPARAPRAARLPQLGP